MLHYSTYNLVLTTFLEVIDKFTTLEKRTSQMQDYNQDKYKDLKDSDVKLKGMIIDHRLNINLVFCACCHHFNGTALQNEKQNV